MSSWGAFGLIANDGKVDNLITATKLLNQRIKDIMCARAKAGMADTSPTLVDIERTHILYVNAHFKPYAAIGFEYNKVRTQSGNAAFGGGVTFSIPQFGDFFHDMVCRVVLDQVQAAPSAVPTVPTTAGIASQFYNLLSNVPLIVAGNTTYQNLVRYCEYPGNRLFKNVKFDVNGNPIDQYDTTIPIMLEKFCVPVNKRTGFDRLVGQEVPVEGYKQLSLDVVYDGDSVNTPAGISSFVQKQSNQTVGLFSTVNAGQSFTNTTLNAAANVVGAAGGVIVPGVGGMLPTTTQGRLFSQYNVSREQVSVVCGPQTPKPIQPPLEIWNKLRFWFNDDVRLSIASVSIPFGQRYISIDLANQSDLVYEVASIGYTLVNTVAAPPVNPFVSVTNNSTSSAAALEIVPTQLTPYLNQNGLGTQGISTMELYINNIFVNPEIHDIYIKRIGFSLIRVYRYQTQNVSAATDDVLLSNLKWPIEYMFVGLRPKYNVSAPTTSNSLTAATVTAGNPNIWRDWHRLTRMVDAVNADGMANFLGGTAYGGGAATLNKGSFPPGVAAGAAAIGIPQPADSGIVQPLGNNLVSSFGSKAAQYWLPVPTVDSLGLSSHGITVYDGYSDKFFNQYAPFHYGGAALNTPEDVGALFVNLCLFPRSYQPSGHLNISRARETYLKYTSSYIGSNSTADMLVVGVAINFLLITDGSAVLRYST